MFRLFTLGGLRLDGLSGAGDEGPAQPRPLAILAILAAHDAQGITRDKLIGLLWPDRTEERARHVLSQSLYVLRRGLRAEELLLSVGGLRVNPAILTSDVAEFVGAVKAKDDERAIALYAGPFLDSFYLSGAPEFEEWVSAERERLATLYCISLERRALALAASEDWTGSVGLWRRRAAQDPFDSRVAINLLRALDRSGAGAEAIRRGDAHNELRQRELGAGPDPEISALLAQLRSARARSSGGASARAVPRRDSRPIGRSPSSVPVTSLSPALTAGIVQVDAADPVPLISLPLPGTPRYTRATRSRRWLTIACIIVASLASLAIARTIMVRRAAEFSPVAIGQIRNHIEHDGLFVAGALPDLLATNLARIGGLDVISRARVIELADARTTARDTSAAFAAAARAAGAQEIIEGAVYRSGSQLRFELQRVDARTGRIRRTYVVEGADAYALVERITDLLVDEYALTSPAIPLGSVTSVSLVGRSFLEEGVRAYYASDLASARRLFAAALAADSTFAMAANYLALVTIKSGQRADAYIALAKRLAVRSTDRERLLILHQWADHEGDPRARAYAESLYTRYPTELDGQLAVARSSLAAGDFPSAIRRFRRIVEVSSAMRGSPGARCRSCEARSALVYVLQLADSLPAAQEIVRERVRRNENERESWGLLGAILERQGLVAEADSAYAKENLVAGGGGEPRWRTSLAIRAGNFAASERMLRRYATQSIGPGREWALQLLSAVLRNRGRPTEALNVARRAGAPAPDSLENAGTDPFVRLPVALALMYGGRARQAATQFDMMAARSPYPSAARTARHRSWMMAQRAHALAIAGDTGSLALLADSIMLVGANSSYARDQRLHHYVRGLLAEARHDWPRSVSELRQARYSTTETYLAVPLARAELATGDARSAAATAAAALRGPLDSQNQYELRTELHEVLADALLGAGESAQAAREYQIVVNAWEGGEESYAQRARRARELRRRIAPTPSRVNAAAYATSTSFVPVAPWMHWTRMPNPRD